MRSSYVEFHILTLEIHGIWVSFKKKLPRFIFLGQVFPKSCLILCLRYRRSMMFKSRFFSYNDLEWTFMSESETFVFYIYL